MPDAESPDTFEYASTLEDQAALLLYASRRPYMLAFQAATYAFVWASFFVMQLAIGLINALFSAQHGLGPAARTYLTEGFPDDLQVTMPIFTAFVIGLMLLSFFSLVPSRCRLLAAKIMSGYPAAAGTRTPRVLASHLRVGEKGFEYVCDDERVFAVWSLVRSFAETRRHFFLMMSRANGLAIAKSSLDAEARDRLREAISRRLAAARPR